MVIVIIWLVTIIQNDHKKINHTFMSNYIELNRSFYPKKEEEINSDRISVNYLLGIKNHLSWNDLFEKSRVVVLAEPGTGKTEEFKEAANRLRKHGKAAFFCQIELLQDPQIKSYLELGL